MQARQEHKQGETEAVSTPEDMSGVHVGPDVAAIQAACPIQLAVSLFALPLRPFIGTVMSPAFRRQGSPIRVPVASERRQHAIAVVTVWQLRGALL